MKKASLQDHCEQVAEFLNPSLPVDVTEKRETKVTRQHCIKLTVRHLREYLALKGATIPDDARFDVEWFNYEYDDHERVPIDELNPVLVTWNTTETTEA